MLDIIQTSLLYFAQGISMQEQIMAAAQDQTGRRYRNQQIFEMTKAALSGLLAASPTEDQAALEQASIKAVHAAKLTINQLIKERVL